MAQSRILTEHLGDPSFATLDGYRAKGGYRALEKALGMGRDAIVEEVKKSNLRGLGGAGFPCGVKWGFMPRQSERPSCLVVNADEGEPATFKDKYLLLGAPHRLIEGALIACRAMDAHRFYVYVRGEYVLPRRALERAIAEARGAGILGASVLGSGFACDGSVHPGAGAYICGEETALIESLEGKKGLPRVKPPFPAGFGAFGWHTTVNNVETLSCVPLILERGGAWWASLGVERNGGTRIFGVSGHVERPGIYEFPMGTPFRTILEEAGGVRGGRALKAFLPGGSSAPVLTAAEIDVPLDFDSLGRAKSMAGSGGIVVLDETTCMVKALHVLTRFYHHESCGQCSPCREGTGWAARIVARILRGDGQPSDIETLKSIADNWALRTICAFGAGAAGPVVSFVTRFRDEFEYHARHGRCDLEPAAAEQPAAAAGGAP